VGLPEHPAVELVVSREQHVLPARTASAGNQSFFASTTLGTAMSGQSHVSNRVNLTDALHFTGADIAANQEGRLSPVQQERLRRAFRRTLIVSVVGIILIGLGAAILIFLGQQNNSTVLVMIGIVLTVINAAILGLLVQSRLRLQGDLTQPIKRQDGIVNRTLRIAGRSPTYILKFEGDDLIVNRDTFNAFIDGAVYKLYRTAATKTLIAAEMVGMRDE
jgi:hypothetical protein